MLEIFRDVLLLLVGAVISFLPQELVRRSEIKQEETREKRKIHQQREEKLWQRDYELFVEIEDIIGAAVSSAMSMKQGRAPALDKQKFAELMSRLYAAQTRLFKYPDANRCFQKFLDEVLKYMTTENSSAFDLEKEAAKVVTTFEEILKSTKGSVT